MTIRLYGSWFSPFARKVALALELKSQLQLPPSEPIQAAEVEVRAPGLQAGAHRLEVDPVGRRVEEHIDAGERPCQFVDVAGVG